MRFLKGDKDKIILLTVIVAVFAGSYFARPKSPEKEALPPQTEAVEQVTEAEEQPETAENPTDAPQTETAQNAEETPLTEEKKTEVEKTEDKKELYCTLSVKCDTILEDITRLEENKRKLVGENGVIFSESKVKFKDGESVFDVLLRVMKENGIHMEYVNTPMYGSVYIEGIGNIYEFDAGELSGWMYKVNGEFPNYGCSKYILKNGDKVEFVYTCDLGKDVGGDYYANSGE